MTQHKSREAFEKYYGAPLTENAKGFTMAQYTAWNAWKAARADVLAMLESEDVVKYMAHHLRTAKAVLAAIAEKVRGK